MNKKKRLGFDHLYLLPKLSTFFKIKNSDNFVFIDDSEFTSNELYSSWHCFVLNPKIRNNRLSIPVTPFPINFDNLQIKIDVKFSQKHITSIGNRYADCKNFDEIFELVKNVYLENNPLIKDFNFSFIKKICNWLEIDTSGIRFSSKVKHEVDKRYRAKKVESYLHLFDCDDFLCTKGYSDYLKSMDNFKMLEKAVVLKDLNSIFPEHSNILDIVMNYDKSEILEMLNFKNVYNEVH